MTDLSDETKIAVLENEVKNLSEKIIVLIKSQDKMMGTVEQLSVKLDDAYVKKEEFTPVKNQVDSLRLWQAKVVGMAAMVAIIVDLLIRLFLTK